MTITSGAQFSVIQANATAQATSAASFNAGALSGASILLTSTGLVAGNGTLVVFNSTANAQLLFTGCEL
jgi:hypothetical protein